MYRSDIEIMSLTSLRTKPSCVYRMISMRVSPLRPCSSTSVGLRTTRFVSVPATLFTFLTADISITSMRHLTGS